MTSGIKPQSENDFPEQGSPEGMVAGGQDKSFFAGIIDTISGWFSSLINFVKGLFSSENSTPRVNGDGTANLGKLKIDAKAVPAWQAYQEANKGAKVEFTNPVRGGFGQITRDLGNHFHHIHKKHMKHDGVDLKPLRDNQEIEASAAGIVLFSGVKEGYGNTVIIGHADGSWTLYAHLRDKPDSSLEGTQVVQRQQIGIMGSSGGSTGVHLHYEQGKGALRVTPIVAEVGELKNGVQYADSGRRDDRLVGLVDPNQQRKLPSGSANRGDEKIPNRYAAMDRKTEPARV